MIPSGIGSYVDRFYVGIIILKGITNTSQNICQLTEICKLGFLKFFVINNTIKQVYNGT